MLSVKKSTTVIEVPAELLQQISKLVKQMILAQTSKIPPTLEKPPQDIVLEGDAQQDPAKEEDGLSTTPDTPPPPTTSDHLPLMHEKWAALEANAAQQTAQQTALRARLYIACKRPAISCFSFSF
ncbi:hypothetical protein TSAR_010817 [Trichomalopsis sarcophagae]|uniref:Uncharacterized protein n=1 Tax=Trichomalopsis sarcophagae TaxID=543379 RepID=A0A232EGI8_9HYME|nr:hypothetical protein TSAR_010817 [Trichomalopsis sarcophagae]